MRIVYSCKALFTMGGRLSSSFHGQAIKIIYHNTRKDNANRRKNRLDYLSSVTHHTKDNNKNKTENYMFDKNSLHVFIDNSIL